MRIASAVVFVALSLWACRERVDAKGHPVEVGRYRLHTFPAGARVWIDGVLKIDATPATLVLKQGKYRLKIQAPGAEAMEKDIEIEAGDVKEETINIPKPPEARIAVRSDAIGADVRINGYRRGVTPLSPVVTRPGPVDITVTTRDGRAKSLRTDLAIGEQKQLDIVFEKNVSNEERQINESKPVPKGKLTLGLKPDGEVLDEDGKKLGETPIVARPMDPGEYELTLRSLDGRYEKRVSITIEPEQAAVFRFQFRDEDQVPWWKPPPGPVPGPDTGSSPDH